MCSLLPATDEAEELDPEEADPDDMGNAEQFSEEAFGNMAG